MALKNIVIKNRYFDSVMLMSLASELAKLDKVANVSAMMGTENNKEVLRNTNMIDADGEKAEPNDLILSIQADDESLFDEVNKKFEELLEAKGDEEGGDSSVELTSINEGIQALEDSNLVLFSIPGPFVKREAMLALNKGKNVMIFSDNVTIEEELALKQRAKELGLIVMGPDCGTSIINNVALAFANVVPKGPIAIIGASGTGIQQVSSILANKGYGLKHAIGLGGRDLSEKIGGISMLTALDAIEKDDEIELVILISKPPHPDVANKVLDRIKDYKKKVVVNFLKGDAEECKKRGIPFSASLEGAANLAIAVYNDEEYKPKDFDEPEKIEKLINELKPKVKDKYMRGLYTGGTLADESLTLLSNMIGDVYSNIPLKDELQLKDSFKSYKHTIVDLGEDEFTKGRPHPMIDYTLRCQRIVEEAEDTGTGIILLDIVTGYGSHMDPKTPLKEAIEKALKINPDLVFVASVCGTRQDPQNVEELENELSKLGVIFLPNNAQATKFVGKLLQ